MDKVVLASRLVEIAKDLSELRTAKSENIVTAMAHAINAYDQDAEVTKMTAQIAELVKVYKKNAARIIEERNAAEEAFKKTDAVVTAYTKNWRRDSGYDKIRAELLSQAQQCLKVGDVLEELEGDLRVLRRVSKQPSYEVAWEVLVSTLNGAEFKKFVARLEGAYAKLFTEIKTGVKDLDNVVKEWSKDAQDIAEERGIKLPKASITAGVVDGFLEVLKSIIPNLIRGIRKWGADLSRAVSGQTAQIDSITNSVLARVNRARAVLAK